MEELAEHSRLDVDEGNAFLLGVLSLLDKVTGSSLEHLLQGMTLPYAMREALLGRGENAYTRLLQYAFIYEMRNRRLIPPDIRTRLNHEEISDLYEESRAKTSELLERMEDSQI